MAFTLSTRTMHPPCVGCKWQVRTTTSITINDSVMHTIVINNQKLGKPLTGGLIVVHLVMSLSFTLCTSVKLQNLSWYKAGFVSRHVLHLLSRLQDWICPKTGEYKTCIVSNTEIEAFTQATKPKPWQSHLTSETVGIFIQNEKAGLGSAQNRFWCGRLGAGAKPVL